MPQIQPCTSCDLLLIAIIAHINVAVFYNSSNKVAQDSCLKFYLAFASVARLNIKVYSMPLNVQTILDLEIAIAQLSKIKNIIVQELCG
ncbi:hypothetical protein C3B55_00857 [Candidatus Pseudomonas adelgestsugas]|uniref:Uncharacterized protein n=1 Tax=Candidatus Pseudomonas adelgestsugas TaxID=1302376 RepID=A0ABX5R944_9PSED|nr:hypothetical protein C3B55_00857 [Candidatus Pseudomonas adelgestsugas]